MTPVEQAKALLGEFCKNYVIIAQDYDNPETYELTFSDPFAAQALLTHANKYQTDYLNAGLEANDEWIWDEEEDEEDWMSD